MDKATNSAMNAASTAGPIVEKLIGLLAMIIEKVLGLMTTLLPLILIGAAAYYGYKYALNFYIESKANEWLIVIRNGEMVKRGIGLCTWIMPTDQWVKFPSLINQVNFSAQQVTSEMQGVEVSGVLIWSVYRQEDGPFRCYKSFGGDLKNPQGPKVANQKLENMAVSIIRDRIANMTINDILKNRQKLRNGVKDEIQKVITGWGIWLETCEVVDVKISSGSLFKNLQTEFREKSRQDAEKIKGEIDNTIRQENLVRETEFSKIQAETRTKEQIFEGEQKLAVQKQEAQLYEEQLNIEAARKQAIANQKLALQQQEARVYTEEIKIGNQKKEALNQQKIRDAEMQNDLAKKNMDLNNQENVHKIQIQMAYESEIQKLRLTQYETKKLEREEQDRIKQLEFKHQEQQLKIKTAGYTEPVLKAMILESTENIYKTLNIKDMKVVNIGGGSSANGGSQDPAGQLIGQVLASYKAIQEGMQ